MSKLDPRTKIVMLFSISGVAMLVSNLWFLIGLLIFTILILVIGRVEMSRQKKQFMGILSMLIFLFILQAIFGQAYFGAVLCVRLIIVVMSALILLTGHMRDYLLALVQWKLPYELAYMVVLAFHFFPILREEALDVYHSIQLRGCELKKTSLKNKLLAFKGMCIPILAGALSRAQDTAIAMEARGFRMHRTRTYMRKLILKKRDILLMILFPVLAVGFVVGAYTYENNKAVLPEKQVTVSLLNNSRIAISWTDDELYDGVVRIGFQKYEAESVQIGTGELYRYTAKIDDLKAGKTYKYTFGHGRDMSEEIRYVHDVNADEYSFLYFGGVQDAIQKEAKEDAFHLNEWCDFVLEAYEVQSTSKLPDGSNLWITDSTKAGKYEIAFGLFAGNLVSDGANTQEWLLLYDRLEPFFVNKPMMTAMGENEATDAEAYKDMVVLPTNGKQREEYYYCDYGDAFIITLNSNIFTEAYRKSVGSEEEYQALLTEATEWLERMLKTNDRPWVIINMHHSMFPLEDYASADNADASGTGSETFTEEARSLMQECWEPLFAEYDVDLVLSGNEGVFVRTNPIDNVPYYSVCSGSVGEEDKLPEDTYKTTSHVAWYHDEAAAYMRVDVTSNWLEITVYDKNHQFVDHMQIQP